MKNILQTVFLGLLLALPSHFALAREKKGPLLQPLPLEKNLSNALKWAYRVTRNKSDAYGLKLLGLYSTSNHLSSPDLMLTVEEILKRDESSQPQFNLQEHCAHNFNLHIRDHQACAYWLLKKPSQQGLQEILTVMAAFRPQEGLTSGPFYQAEKIYHQLYSFLAEFAGENPIVLAVPGDIAPSVSAVKYIVISRDRDRIAIVQLDYGA